MTLFVRPIVRLAQSLTWGLLLTLVLGLGLAAPAWAEPPLWVVHGPHATIVLFGSVHLLPEGLKWEPQALKDDIAHADDLWFEIPIDDAAALAAAQTALSRGMQPAGVTLRSELSVADQARLAHIAAKCGVSVDRLDPLKPWLAEVTLALAAYRQAGALQDDGVEKTLSASAPPHLMRRAFETPQEQIGYLSGASLPDQIASLRQTLTELEQGAASYQRLVAAWNAGDVKGLEAEAVDPLRDEAPGVYKLLVIDRNRRWIDAIRQRLAGSGLSVMVVGVGHLVGPDSVPALLRAQGIKVDGPEAPAPVSPP